MEDWRGKWHAIYSHANEGFSCNNQRLAAGMYPDYNQQEKSSRSRLALNIAFAFALIFNTRDISVAMVIRSRYADGDAIPTDEDLWVKWLENRIHFSLVMRMIYRGHEEVALICKGVHQISFTALKSHPVFKINTF